MVKTSYDFNDDDSGEWEPVTWGMVFDAGVTNWLCKCFWIVIVICFAVSVYSLTRQPCRLF